MWNRFETLEAHDCWMMIFEITVTHLNLINICLLCGLAGIWHEPLILNTGGVVDKLLRGTSAFAFMSQSHHTTRPLLDQTTTTTTTTSDAGEESEEAADRSRSEGCGGALVSLLLLRMLLAPHAAAGSDGGAGLKTLWCFLCLMASVLPRTGGRRKRSSFRFNPAHAEGLKGSVQSSRRAVLGVLFM